MMKLAERRMFAKTIVTSDAFLDMPSTTRCLYFTLAMFADDDGFVNNPKSIMRQIGASTDDINILLAKRYILSFDSGIIVIKHWKIHNYIQKDRYKETKYLEEKATLALDEKGAYTECIQDVSKVDTQVRLGQGRLGQDRVVEVSGDDGQADNGSHLELRRGSLGKGVVLLTDEQDEALLEELGFDAYNHYIDKLATFIIEKGAKVSNHYATIIKWAKEDSML